LNIKTTSVVYTAYDFKVSVYHATAGSNIETVEAFGITTLVYAVQHAWGFRFIMHDELQYPDVIACVDFRRLELALAGGVSLRRLLEPRHILKYIPKRLLKGVESPNALAEEVGKVFLRWYLGAGVLEPLLRSEMVNDVAVDPLNPDGTPNVYLRARGFGDAYHQVVIEPNECGLTANQPEGGNGFLGRLAGLFRLGGAGSEGGDEEVFTFNQYIVNKYSELTRSPVTAYQPYAMSTYAKLRIRGLIVGEPISTWVGAYRKHPLGSWTIPALISSGSLTPALGAKLLVATAGIEPYVGRKIPILAIGEMGSGKTTLTAATANTLPPWERVAFVQDVDEYRPLPGRTFILLNTRESSGLGVRAITKSELIALSMRSGAQYVTVNEVLTAEDVNAWLLAVFSGHGGFTTIHSSEWVDLANRLAAFGVSNPVDVLRRIIVVLMREKRAVRVWWPVDTKWCADAREGRVVGGVLRFDEGLGVCVEEPPFDGGDYPRDFAESLKSLSPMVGSDEVAMAWLRFLATLPGYNYAKVLNFQASNYLAEVGGGNAVVVEEKVGGEEGGPERGSSGS
jgi:type IV secretory pathway ATPase VirB11/archaellum biosynthesis ATPase